MPEYIKEISRIKALPATGKPERCIAIYSEVNGQNEIQRQIYCDSAVTTSKLDMEHDTNLEMAEYGTHLEQGDIENISRIEFEALWRNFEFSKS